MAEKFIDQLLTERMDGLETELEQLKRLEKINAVLFKISHAVNVTICLEQLFKSIHSALSPIVDTTNFFIALYDQNQDSITFPYIVDSVDESYPPVLKISKTESLTAKVIRTGVPVLMTKSEVLREREKSTFRIPSCTPAEIWLGVPLKIRYEIVGVMAVQNYENPLCYDQSDVVLMVSVAEQVALAIDRKRKEDQLRISEEKYRRIVTTANEGIMILDADWSINYTNDHLSQMFGYNPGELMGKSFDSLLFKDDMNDFAQQKRDRIGGVSSKFERRFKTKDGRTLWTLVSASALFTDDGVFNGSFGMITDISKRKKAEEELQVKVAELKEALDDIKILRGILPICSHCKKIRDDKGYWNQLESYVSMHSEADFSHSICPECIRTHYPDFDILED